MSNYDMLAVECKVINGRVLWKIIVKPAAVAKAPFTDPVARTMPPRPFSYEDEDLLKVVRHMERVVGLVVSDPVVK